jgi:AcrR family transcriptional regulator
VEPTAARRKYSPRRPREERREQLLDAALRIVDAEGFGAFSIEAVAREAGLAKTVVYASFDTREHLLQALVDRELDRATAKLTAAIPLKPGGDPEELLGEALTEIFEAASARPETWRLFVLPAEGMPFEARAHVQRRRKKMLAAVEPLVAWGLGRQGLGELDATVGTELLVAAGEQGIRMMLADPDRFPPQRLVEFAVGFFAAHLAQG